MVREYDSIGSREPRGYWPDFMAGFAIHLAGQPISHTGQLVDEATRFGPAIYHILFAGVASRCYRNLAFWRTSPSPNGIELGELGQTWTARASRVLCTAFSL